MFKEINLGKDMMNLLLQNDADPNYVDVDGCTVLHYAATAESETMINKLIEAGANKEIADIDGNKPSDYTETENIRLLLQ